MTGCTTCTELRLHSLRVSAKSEWLFLELLCDDGIAGYGEATMEGHEPAVKQAVGALARLAAGRPLATGPASGALRNFARGDAARYTAISALEQAVWDAEGKRRGLPVARLLGASPVSSRLYANINRSTTRRTPEGFAARARAAIADGFGAIKIAPFDGLDWTRGRETGQAHLYRAGLDRIAATREAAGPDIALMIDCHWRFDPDSAAQLIEDVAPFGLYWVECPVPEVESAIRDVTALRALCARRGMKLAGLETLNGVEAFLPWLEAGALDVVMPDVKYAGGLGECLRVAQASDLYGAECSPHNPTGPVCHAASLHVASALPNCPLLEHQYGETPLFHDILRNGFPPLIDGRASPPPGPGLGIDLALPASAERVDASGCALEH